MPPPNAENMHEPTAILPENLLSPHSNRCQTKVNCEYCQLEHINHKRHLLSCNMMKDEIRCLEIKLQKNVNLPHDNLCRFCHIMFSRSDKLKDHQKCCKKRKEYHVKLKQEYIDNSRTIEILQRQGISQALKRSIAMSQSDKCNICHNFLKLNFHIDHILPVCDGGGNKLDNLQALCLDCHASKTRYECANRASSRRAMRGIADQT